MDEIPNKEDQISIITTRLRRMFKGTAIIGLVGLVLSIAFQWLIPSVFFGVMFAMASCICIFDHYANIFGTSVREQNSN